ncbi:MAG TPA: hypothetical protein VGB55_01030, partial [Tepidisphaeraceae bacterium]
MRRTAWAILFFCLLICGPVLAQSDVSLSVSINGTSVIPANRYVPLTVRIRNPGKAAFDGVIRTSVTTSGGTVEYRRPVTVPAESAITTDFVAAFEAPEPLQSNRNAPPMATFELLGSDGNPIAMEPVSAVSDNPLSDGSPIPGAVIAHITADYAGESQNIDELPEVLETVVDYQFTLAEFSPRTLMRRPETYEAIRLIVLSGDAVDQLDPAQQAALLQHVRGGATLLVDVPLPTLAASWLGPYLPMDVVGRREVSELPTVEHGKLPLVGPMLVADSILRAGAIATSTGPGGPLAAYFQVGAGRIAMMSVSTSAIDPAKDRSAQYWTDLLGVNRPEFHTAEYDAAELAKVLPSMTGLVAP